MPIVTHGVTVCRFFKGGGHLLLWKVSVWNLTDYWDNILTIVCRFHIVL